MPTHHRPVATAAPAATPATAATAATPATATVMAPGKRAGARDYNRSHNPKLVKKKGAEQKKPAVEHTPADTEIELVRHVYSALADVQPRTDASPNVGKGLLDSRSFCKMLISTKRPHYGGLFANTVPTGMKHIHGCNHMTNWAEPLLPIRAEVRFWCVNPNEHTTLVELTMWTAHPSPSERVFLRTLIKTDGSQDAVYDLAWVYNVYFAVTEEELSKNNDQTTFLFKLDISMQREE